MILLLLLLCNLTIHGTISMVYNFRIAQITKQPIAEQSDDHPNSVMGLLFDVYEQKYNQIHQNFGGGLATYIRNFIPYYFRIDGAVSHIKASLNGTTSYSGTQTDDILFTMGRDFLIGEQAKVTISGLFGIPTHAITGLQHASFGYGQVGLGGQLDGIYNLNSHYALIGGTRYIHFFGRKAYAQNQDLYKFNIGNILDLLFAGKYNGVKQGLELGYTARFQFGAKISPFLANATSTSNYIRNSFYGVYKYRFKIHELQNRFLLNLAYGFDSRPKTTGNKNIITVWGSWTVNF